MQPSFSDLVPDLLAIALLSLAIVFVMVRWSSAMLALPSIKETPIAPVEGWSPVQRWGLAYLAVWALLIVAFLRLLKRTGAADTGRNVLLMLGVALGWFLFNWLWIAFARALQRANERAAARAEELTWQQEELVDTAEEPAGEEPEIEPAVAPPAPPPTIGAKIRGVLRTVLSLVLFLLVIGIGEALPPLQRLHAWTVAHQRQLLEVTIPIGVLGFALFMYCVVRMALAQGEPMDREEIDDLFRRNREQAMGPGLWRRYTYRSRGFAVGSEAKDSASFSEIKEAWRTGAWRTSARWRRMFLMLLAVALLTTGLFGSLFVVATAGVKLVLGGAYLYAVVRTAVGFSKA